MDKRITLDEETVRKLKILAANNHTDVKNFIQDTLKELVKKVK